MAWQPDSWKSKQALQMAEWEDKQLAGTVLEKIGKLPPLVQPAEAESLRKKMAEAGRGERFIIQGGDCAERFMDCEGERLEDQLKLMMQMGMVHEEVTGTPSLCIMRVAGQYGKPRSKPTEVVEGHGEIMSFKGDNINGFEPEDRKWDPERLLQGYFHSAATLNFLRSYSTSTEAVNLSNMKLETLSGSKEFSGIKSTAEKISGAAKGSNEFFTAHEAMQLDLEQALTRKVGDKFYNLSAHLVWIGDRTRGLDGAHIEYFRGIANPIGVKVGPSMKPDELKELVKILNPNKEEGRLMLITRYGAGKVEEMLTAHIEAVKATGIPVVWQCDGVHGNTYAAPNKYKTRKLNDILEEIKTNIAVHKKCGTVLGGIHLECTGQDVTECVGGPANITEEDLPKNYETFCDPRLNYAQSIEAVFEVASKTKASK